MSERYQKKPKEVGNDDSLASMFARQQVSLEQGREAYYAQLQKGKGTGLDEAAQAELCAGQYSI
jgi:hypothetical protein